MSKARSLADLISGNATIEASEIADSTITGGKLASDITINTTGTVTTSQVNLGDNESAYFGTGNDLSIYHSGTSSWIKDVNGTSNLILASDQEVQIRNSTGSEYKARFITNGAAELYYDNSKKFETVSGGIDVTGRTTTDTLTVTSSALFQTSGSESSSSTYIQSLSDGGNSYLVFKGGNYRHTTQFKTSWYSNTYMDIVSSYSTDPASLNLYEYDSSGNVDHSTRLSTATSYFYEKVAINTTFAGHELTVFQTDTPAIQLVNNASGGGETDGSIFTLESSSSSTLIIKNQESDADILIKGNDGGSEITALTFDMSDAGSATFNDKIILGTNKIIDFSANSRIFDDGTDMHINSYSYGTIKIYGSDVYLNGSGTTPLEISSQGVAFAQFIKENSGDLVIKSKVQDKDFVIRGNDGGSSIDALTFDMSEQGNATFNKKVTIGSDLSIPTDGGRILFANNGSNGNIKSLGGKFTFHNNAGSSGDDSLILSVASGRKIQTKANVTRFTNEAGTSEFGKFDSSGLDVTGNITVSGNLTVNGTTTTVNTTNTTITDNLLELNSGATANTNDAGIIIERGSTGHNCIITC